MSDVLERGPPPSWIDPSAQPTPHRFLDSRDPYNGVSAFLFGSGAIVPPEPLFILAASCTLAGEGSCTAATTARSMGSATLAGVGQAAPGITGARLSGAGRVLGEAFTRVRATATLPGVAGFSATIPDAYFVGAGGLAANAVRVLVGEVALAGAGGVAANGVVA